MITLTAIAMPSWNETAAVVNAVANLVKAMAWPLLVAAVLIFFSKRFDEILKAFAAKVPDITSGKLGPIRFTAKVKEVALGGASRLLGPPKSIAKKRHTVKDGDGANENEASHV